VLIKGFVLCPALQCGQRGINYLSQVYSLEQCVGRAQQLGLVLVMELEPVPFRCFDHCATHWASVCGPFVFHNVIDDKKFPIPPFLSLPGMVENLLFLLDFYLILSQMSAVNTVPAHLPYNLELLHCI
jgi:hypothetical protein